MNHNWFTSTETSYLNLYAIVKRLVDELVSACTVESVARVRFPSSAKSFFHPKTDIKPGSTSSLASPRHDREGALFPSSPRPNSTPRMGRGLSQSCYLLDTNFEHKAMCTNSYTGRVQKRILRRWLQFSPAVTLDDLIFLHNCVGFLHIFCRNICTHRSV